MAVQTEGVVLDSLTSDPGSPEDGQTWYNSTTKKFYKRVNSITEEVSFTSTSGKTSVRITTTASIANLSNCSVTQSGVTLVQNERLLVMHGASRDGVEAVNNSHNGVYVCGVVTAGFAPFTRASDANTAAKLAGMTVFCQGCGNGHALALAASNITLETTNLIYIDPNSVSHKILRQLIHLADGDGPFEGFTSGAYKETTPSGNPFPTSVIWWTSSGKTAKIVEETISYNANKTINTDAWKVYDTDGTTVLVTATDTVAYSGAFETSRTRVLT
jgi:hypothetical protein